MKKLPIPNLLNRYEEIKLYKYVCLLNNFIIQNQDKKQLYICISGPQNGGKTAILQMISTFLKTI